MAVNLSKEAESALSMEIGDIIIFNGDKREIFIRGINVELGILVTRVIADKIFEIFKLDWTKGNVFSEEDKDFMKKVQLDLTKYIQRNIFPSRTVLVFPPFNGFRRFLIHKLIEDYFTTKDLAAFSIGQDISRRIVVCYKGLIRSDQSKKLEGSTSNQSLQFGMIDKEKQGCKQKSTPTVAVYRPPAARMAESKRRVETEKNDSRRIRVRRPDQQMYVPRPRRSLNSSDESSQIQSSSRTSLDFDTSENTHFIKSEKTKTDFNEDCDHKNQPPTPTAALKKTPRSVTASQKVEFVRNSSNAEHDIDTAENTERPFQDIEKASLPESYCSPPNGPANGISSIGHGSEQSDKFGGTSSPAKDNLLTNCTLQNDFPPIKICLDDINSDEKHEQDEETKTEVLMCKDTCSEPNNSSKKSEVMDAISISSDSRCNEGTSTDESRSSDSSSDTEVEKDDSFLAHQNFTPEKKLSASGNELAEGDNVCVPCEPPVFVISDTSSDSVRSEGNAPKEGVTKKDRSRKGTTKKKPKLVNPENCDWESLYDESGECLVPNLMEELTNSVGRVKVASVDSDYRSYQSVEERTSDGECVIEIYDFPAEFKTTDLFNIFAAYRSKHFQIKWVDDTHALGVFPSPIVADEVLACTLPFVKTRPLRLGIRESKSKARSLVLPVLPPMERPKTCPALARRLVSGALGLRLPTSAQDREKEKQVLKEAREKRRLEAKQREAAWDGTLTSIL